MDKIDRLLYIQHNWETQMDVIMSVKAVVPWWLLLSVNFEAISPNGGVRVVVRLLPWAWLWLGEKHKFYQMILEYLCASRRPRGCLIEVVVK